MRKSTKAIDIAINLALGSIGSILITAVFTGALFLLATYTNPNPPVQIDMQQALQKHPYCYSEGCMTHRNAGEDTCTYHRVFYKVDRAVTDSIYCGIRQQHKRHGVAGASDYGPRLHSTDR